MNCLRGDPESSCNFVYRFDNYKDFVFSYLEERIQDTNNNRLKAKYNFALYLLRKDNKYCIESIMQYKTVVSQKSLGKYDPVAIEAVELIIKLSTKIKHKLDELREYICALARETDTCDKVKYIILSICEEVKLYRASHKETPTLLKLLIDIAKRQDDCPYQERCLELALCYAKKFQNIPEYKSLIADIYEGLGDCCMKQIIPEDENNAMIPHLNETILKKCIVYYKGAGNSEKLKNATLSFRENSGKKVFPTTHLEGSISSEETEAFIRLIEYFAKLPASDAVCYLILGGSFNVSSQGIKDMIEAMKTSDLENSFTHEIQDINNNSKPIDYKQYMCFWSYNSLQDNIYTRLIMTSIAQSIENKKLTYKKLHSSLRKHTSFGEVRTKIINGMPFPYTWLSIIEPGLKEYFNQVKALLKGKTPDWRICIDILAVKFEGILREILWLNGANLTIFKGNESQIVTLEHLLRFEHDQDSNGIKEAFYKTFNEDDLMLFQYVFTNTAGCLNIRNNVAHCFYIPAHYTEKLATLLLFCILRLAKYRDA